jgi:hypothetical protein
MGVVMRYIKVTYLDDDEVVSRTLYGEVTVLDGGVLKVEYRDNGQYLTLIFAPGRWLSVMDD